MRPRPASPHRGIVRPISIAPMMDRTDRHFRRMMRLISARALLYTEMVVTRAVLHGDRDRLLGYHPSEHPLALQLGGDDPGELAECARIAEDRGYDEVNLNVGCPSSRVQEGSFGVCLMLRPDAVAAAVAAMRGAVAIPVTVKHRIGVDDVDGYADMERFVRIVAEAGADRFTVHARKAWLKGLSPKQNRTVPPLRYADVHRLKADHPGLIIEINGGLSGLDAYRAHLDHVDAVMVGRAAYDDPFHLIGVDPEFFGEPAPVRSRDEVVEAMVPYLDDRLAAGDKPHHVARHLANLFAGYPGARAWRQELSRACQRDGATGTMLLDALRAQRESAAPVLARRATEGRWPRRAPG